MIQNHHYLVFLQLSTTGHQGHLSLLQIEELTLTVMESNSSCVASRYSKKETYIYDNIQGLWSDNYPMNHARKSPQAGLIQYPNNSWSIIVAGGEEEITTEIFNFDQKSWTEGPELPYRIKSAASVQWNNSFIIVGGNSESGRLKTLWKFDVESENWKLMEETLPTKGSNQEAFLVPDEYCQTKP